MLNYFQIFTTSSKPTPRLLHISTIVLHFRDCYSNNKRIFLLSTRFTLSSNVLELYTN